MEVSICTMLYLCFGSVFALIAAYVFASNRIQPLPKNPPPDDPYNGTIIRLVRRHSVRAKKFGVVTTTAVGLLFGITIFYQNVKVVPCGESTADNSALETIVKLIDCDCGSGEVNTSHEIMEESTF